jgi:hypothetical protein
LLGLLPVSVIVFGTQGVGGYVLESYLDTQNARKGALTGASSGSGAWIRTSDLRVMSSNLVLVTFDRKTVLVS